MFKLIILLTAFSPVNDFESVTYYPTEQECVGMKVYKLKKIEDALFDDKETNVTAYCVEVK